jgi:hypothetical protein
MLTGLAIRGRRGRYVPPPPALNEAAMNQAFDERSSNGAVLLTGI